jgi:hypothetical protein
MIAKDNNNSSCIQHTVKVEETQFEDRWFAPLDALLTKCDTTICSLKGKIKIK